MKTYELMVILDASPEAEKIERTVSKIEELIQGKKGKIQFTDNWGRRRLAYEIQRHQYGYYSLYTFEMDPKEVIDLNRVLRLNPMVLRHLIILLNPKMLAQAASRPKPTPLDEEVEDMIGLEPDLMEPFEEEPLEKEVTTYEEVVGQIPESADSPEISEKTDSPDTSSLEEKIE
jgi:small subunit ribosomal protein S6